MTLKNNRTPFLSYFKVRASINSNWSYSLETPNSAQNRQFLSHATLRLDNWPWKTIGHPYYTTSSFVHHFIASGEFKLELQSRNVQFRSNMAIFLSHATLKFDGWPWRTIWHLFYATSSSVHHFVAICEFKLELWCGIAQIGPKFALTSVTLTLRMDITFAHGNDSWKFHDNTMTGTWWKRCDKQTDRLMDGRKGLFVQLLGHS